MPLAEGQVQVRDLVMGPGTVYETLRGFDPWTRQVRAEQGDGRAWGDGAWSGAEWTSDAVVPIPVRVKDAANRTPGGWLAAHQRLAAAFAPSHEDVELRWCTGGVEYVLFGRPRMVEPNVDTVPAGWSYTRCAFAALDPNIYSGVEHSMTLGLPSTVGGLTVPGGWSVLNSNPFFESGVSSWTAIDGAIVQTMAQAHEGAASMLITPSGTGPNPRAESERLSVSSGLSYRVSAWVRCSVSRIVDVNISWFTSGGAFISNSIYPASVAADTWTYAQGDFVAPPTAGLGSVQVRMTGTPPASHLLYVDEVTLSEVGAGLTLPLTVPASVTSGRAIITNAGTKDTGLRVRVDGPVVEPRISLLTDAGTAIVRVWATLTSGQWLDIDTAARTVYLNGTASRRGVTTAEGIGWPVLPRGTHELAFDAAAYSAAATATVTWRDTWH